MYLDLLVLANGHGTDALILSLFLGQQGRHGLSEHVGGGIEMAFEAYTEVRGHQGMELPDSSSAKERRGSWPGSVLGSGGTTTTHSPVPVPAPVACAQARK